MTEQPRSNQKTQDDRAVDEESLRAKSAEALNNEDPARVGRPDQPAEGPDDPEYTGGV